MTMANPQETSRTRQKAKLQVAMQRDAARVHLTRPTSRSGDVSALQPGSQNRGWIGRHPALFGALVGAGTGAVSAATMENELFCSGGDDDCVFYGGGRVFVGAGIGAGVGALVGWLVGLGTR
jgi:hypothetical protein